MSINVPAWAKLTAIVVCSTITGGVAVGAAFAGASGDLKAATEGVTELRPRVNSLELWRSAQDERWREMRELLVEVRADVKALKERR